jgi:hypothetical protein
MSVAPVRKSDLTGKPPMHPRVSSCLSKKTIAKRSHAQLSASLSVTPCASPTSTNVTPSAYGTPLSSVGRVLLTFSPMPDPTESIADVVSAVEETDDIKVRSERKRAAYEVWKSSQLAKKVTLS